MARPWLDLQHRLMMTESSTYLMMVLLSGQLTRTASEYSQVVVFFFVWLVCWHCGSRWDIWQVSAAFSTCIMTSILILHPIISASHISAFIWAQTLSLFLFKKKTYMETSLILLQLNYFYAALSFSNDWHLVATTATLSALNASFYIPLDFK